MGATANKAPRIDELVGYLGAHAVAELGELRRQLPMLEAELALGLVAGESSALLTERAQVSLTGLRVMQAETASTIRVFESRLHLVRQLRLIGQIATALGSASVVGFTLGKLGIPALGSGIIALVGSIAVIGVDHFSTLGDASLLDHYAHMRELRFEASRISDELSLRIEHRNESWDDSVVDQLIRDANDVARKLNVSLAKSQA